MNKTTRQLVLLLGIMSFLILAVLSFQLTSSNEPDRSNFNPNSTVDINDTVDEPKDSPDNNNNNNNQGSGPGGLLDQSINGLKMLVEDFVTGISYFL